MKFSPYILTATLLSGSAIFACSSDKDEDGNGSTDSSGDTDSDSDSDSAGTTDRTTATTSGDSAGTTAGNGDGDGDGDGDGKPNNNNKGNSACGLAEGRSDFFGNADINDVEGLDVCGGETREVESVAADIFILLDKSTSMSEKTSNEEDAPTRWEALTTSLKEFFVASESQNLRVGIQYFGLPATNDSAASDQGLSCDPEEYAEPDVEIAILKDNADAMVASIDDHAPDSLTPTHAALEGALMYTKKWAEDHPDRPAVLVLATDGYPTVCEDTSINGLEDLVEAYANPTDGSPAVPTFVLGIGEVSNLERVAAKGGTGNAFFVADCPTATEDLLAALKRVANSPAACEFELPDSNEGGQVVSCDKVNVIYQQSGTSITESIPHVGSEGQCTSAGGWYYSDTSCTPEETQILICPSSCRKLGGGSVRLVVGCDQIQLN